VEGYTESAASGILAGLNLHRVLAGEAPTVPPATTMLGGLMRYLREAEAGRFQPMNSNFGLLDPLAEHVRDKADRRQRVVDRARHDLREWLEAHGLLPALAAAPPEARGGGTS
jgi:methylenetetrahydrofolate--tRNA-(uracil-5-)-methyltransferase